MRDGGRASRRRRSEILARVRKVIGKELPLLVSLDLHANVTPEMVKHADALIAYRTILTSTWRHRPGGGRSSGADAEDQNALRKGVPAITVPDSDQLAMHQRPADQGHLSTARGAADDAVPTLSFAPGFPAADFRDCGPSVFAYGKTQADADAAADQLVALIVGHEDDFDGRIYTPDEGVRHAMELARTASKPIIIADTEDNPGAGGDSDTTGMLRALVRNKAVRAAHGVIYDPQSARAAHAAGVGATVTLALGASPASPATRRTRKASSSKSCRWKFVAPVPIMGAAT